MSGKGAREAVFPTRMTLNVTKQRLKGAQTGHSLLKRKADALTKRFRTITHKIDAAKRKMGRVMQLAAFSLAEVQYATGDVGFVIRESVKNASFKVHAKQENVSGVFLPAFEAVTAEKGTGQGEWLCRRRERAQRCAPVQEMRRWQ
jgi:V-type H+-transporting ATPase subunit D